MDRKTANIKSLKKSLKIQLDAFNNYLEECFNQIWSNEIVFFKVSQIIESYLFSDEYDSDKTYVDIIKQLGGCINLCNDFHYIESAQLVLAKGYLNKAMDILRVPKSKKHIMKKGDNYYELKLIENLINFFYENGGIAINGNHSFFDQKLGKFVIVPKGGLKNDEYQVEAFNDKKSYLEFCKSYKMDTSQSIFDKIVFIDKPPRKRNIKYVGNSIAVLVDKELKVKFVEMECKDQVKMELKQIIHAVDVSIILKNALKVAGLLSNEKKSGTDKISLKSVLGNKKVPENIKVLIREQIDELGLPEYIEDSLDECLEDDGFNYCQVIRNETYKIEEVLNFIIKALESLDKFKLNKDAIKEQIKHQICIRKSDDFQLDEISLIARSRNPSPLFADNQFRFFIF